MIVLDIETTGLDCERNGILSIGALCFNNPEKQFYEECKIDKDDLITSQALKVNGFSREEITDGKKQSQEELIRKFFNWINSHENRILAGQNIGFFDLNFIKSKAKKYCINSQIKYRAFDLSTAAQLIHHQINKKFLLDNYKENAMTFAQVLKFCGLIDQRKAHNALEDAKLAAECFCRLLHGTNLFSEYQHFKIPNYLIQK